MNKSAKLLSIWWFFVLAVVSTGIVVGTLAFYGADINVKGIEAETLTNKIIDCLVNQGKINQDFLETDYDIFENCNLNRSLLAQQGKYFIKITISDYADKKGEGVKMYGTNFEESCKIQKTVNAENFPICSEEEMMVRDIYDNNLKLNVLTGSNYLEGDLYE